MVERLAARVGRAIASSWRRLPHAECGWSAARRGAASPRRGHPRRVRAAATPRRSRSRTGCGSSTTAPGRGSPAESAAAAIPSCARAWEADPYATTPRRRVRRRVAARAFPVLEGDRGWLADGATPGGRGRLAQPRLRLRLAALLGIPLADYRRRLVLEPGSYSIITFAAGRTAVRRIGVLPPDRRSPPARDVPIGVRKGWHL